MACDFAAPQFERAGDAAHLPGAFEMQDLRRNCSAQYTPRPRPALAPARQDEFAVRDFGGGATGFDSGEVPRVFAQLEGAAEHKALKLITYAAQVFDNGAIHHPRVLSGEWSWVKQSSLFWSGDGYFSPAAFFSSRS